MSESPSITDEGVARLRARIGVPQPHPQPPHYRCPNEDAFRHVAEAYGDDNPLWSDPVYAGGTRWRGPLAPPPLFGGVLTRRPGGAPGTPFPAPLRGAGGGRRVPRGGCARPWLPSWRPSGPTSE